MTSKHLVKAACVMKKKSTNDLHNELIAASDLNRFLTENEEEFINQDFSELLHKLFQKKNISKAALAKRSSMSDVYLYQIFSNGRKPSRNRILCLCFGLSASLEETQELLKHSGHAQLYAKDRRDAIVIYGIVHNMELTETNDMLFAEHEDTLF